jgi:tetratricopeptide (TPR) repeat protein
MTVIQLCKAIWSRLRRGPAAPLIAPVHRILVYIINYGQRLPGHPTARWLNRWRASALMLKAHRSASQGRHEDALRDLQRCLKLVPGDGQVLFKKLQIEAHLQRYDEALDSGLLALSQAPALRQVRPSIEYLLSVPALAERHDEVLRRLRPPTPDSPDAAALREAAEELMPAFVRRADHLMAAGEVAAASQLLQRCQSLAPESLLARLAFVRLRLRELRFADALDLCLGILETDPANDAAVGSLAEILPHLRVTHRMDGVGLALPRYLKAKPDSTAGLNCLVHWIDALVRNGGVRAAAGAIEEALATGPEARRLGDRIAHLLTLPEQRAGSTTDAAARGPRLGGALAMSAAPSAAEQDAYDRLVALNVVDTVRGVVLRFYKDLGYDPQSAPLVAFLAQARAHFGNPSLADAAGSTWPLLRFEAACSLYLNGDRTESIRLLRALADDPMLPRLAKEDPFAKEALVRSGEIVGRHDERAGQGELAMITYGQTMQIEENGVVARRMAVLRWRKGDIRGAMEAADCAVMTKHNLFPRLPEGPYVAWLRQQLAEKGHVMSKPSENAG